MNTTFNPLQGIVRFILATLASFAASMTANLILGSLNPFQAEAGPEFMRLYLGSSMLIGNMLVFMIQDTRYHGVRLFALTLAAYIGAAQLLAHAETVAFNFMFRFGPRELLYIILSQALTALLFVPLAMAVAGKWKAPKEAAEDRTGTFLPEQKGSLILRLMVLGGLWYLCYMLAGYLIADPITHGYYAAKHPDLPKINSWLPILQFFRGLGWTFFMLLGIRIMNRPARESGVLIGLAYGVFHAAGLLLPSAFMPTEMRLAHFPEIVISLVMYGPLVVSVMGYRRRKAA